VEVGDNVVVTTRTGEVRRFIVADLSEDYVFGEGLDVELEDVESLEVRRMNVGATVALIAVLTVAGLEIIATTGPFAAVTW
jgi:hypothetical protein